MARCRCPGRQRGREEGRRGVVLGKEKGSANTQDMHVLVSAFSSSLTYTYSFTLHIPRSTGRGGAREEFGLVVAARAGPAARLVGREGVREGGREGGKIRGGDIKSDGTLKKYQKSI